MQGLHTPGAVLGTALIFVFTTLPAFGQTTLVTNRSDISSDFSDSDYIEWDAAAGGVIVPTTVPNNPFSANTTGQGVPFSVKKEIINAPGALDTYDNLVTVLGNDPGEFPGDFAADDWLLDTNIFVGALYPTGFVFTGFADKDLCALGTQIQPILLDAGLNQLSGGSYTASIEAFDSGDVSLGSFDVGGTSNNGIGNTAAFIGIESSDPISTVVVWVSAGNGIDLTWDAINRVEVGYCSEEPPPAETLSKALVGGNDVDGDNVPDLVVEAGASTPAAYDFSIHYTGEESVLILDTVPAEWGAPADPGYMTDDAANDLNCADAGANGKNNAKSATKIGCLAAGGRDDTSVFHAQTRCNAKNGKCKPNSCGALYLNNGARAYLTNDKGKPVGDPLYASNSLCLAAVKDLNGGGLDYTGAGDEDGDNLTDYVEACDLGLDPCNADSDGDGVNDDLDACPLQGQPGTGEYTDTDGCNQPLP